MVPVAVEAVRSDLEADGDGRLEDQAPDRLAEIVAADVALYNGQELSGVDSVEEAARLLKDDLEIARDLFEQVCRAEGRELPEGDPVGEGFVKVFRGLSAEKKWTGGEGFSA